jgi:hypothetical protein
MTNLLVSPQRLAEHIEWLSRGDEEDGNKITPEFLIHTMVATILSIVVFRADEEKELLDRLQLKWVYRPSGQRVICNKEVAP